MQDTVLSVSDFVALINQTLEFAYPFVVVEGEVSSYRVSKGKWIYFDLKDDESTVKMFSSVYQLRQPLEDGMLVKVQGTPRLHNKFGFSLNVNAVSASGEGSIKRAFELLRAKLEKEGLFDESRKRVLPEYPKRIGLITSDQAAAYADFMKIINQRWGGLEIELANVQVQGEAAPNQIVKALEYFNQSSTPVDVIALIRGGGSIEDLQAFNTEEVCRAVSSSKYPIIVGVGHETDISLADLSADLRATTPTNAAQLIVPDRAELENRVDYLVSILIGSISKPRRKIEDIELFLKSKIEHLLDNYTERIESNARVLRAYDPSSILSKGYSIVRTSNGAVLKDVNSVKKKDKLTIKLSNGQIEGEVTDVKKQ